MVKLSTFYDNTYKYYCNNECTIYCNFITKIGIETSVVLLQYVLFVAQYSTCLQFSKGKNGKQKVILLCNVRFFYISNQGSQGTHTHILYWY